jgi:ferritin
MMKILEYILKRGAEVQVTAIPAPPDCPSSIHNCFEKVFKHEVENNVGVSKLAKMSFDEEDWANWNFTQGLMRGHQKQDDGWIVRGTCLKREKRYLLTSPENYWTGVLFYK